MPGTYLAVHVQAALESVLQKGTRETIEDGIVMVTDRSSMRVSFAAINEVGWGGVGEAGAGTAAD